MRYNIHSIIFLGLSYLNYHMKVTFKNVIMLSNGKNYKSKTILCKRIPNRVKCNLRKEAVYDSIADDI